VVNASSAVWHIGSPVATSYTLTPIAQEHWR
jgi:hypothetical protein